MITAYKTTVEKVGGCNACSTRNRVWDSTVWEIKMGEVGHSNFSFRLCTDCLTALRAMTKSRLPRKSGTKMVSKPDNWPSSGDPCS